MHDIAVNDYVKIGIYELGGVEKLWFKVMFIDNDGTFIGRCSNTPICVMSIEQNQCKAFNISDILAIYND